VAVKKGKDEKGPYFKADGSNKKHHADPKKRGSTENAKKHAHADRMREKNKRRAKRK